MSNLLTEARRLRDAGLSIIPIKRDADRNIHTGRDGRRRSWGEVRA